MRVIKDKKACKLVFLGSSSKDVEKAASVGLGDLQGLLHVDEVADVEDVLLLSVDELVAAGYK